MANPERKAEIIKRFGVNIGDPATRALETINVTKLSELTKFTEKELMDLHGFGPRALRLLKETLKSKGLSLKQ